MPGAILIVHHNSNGNFGPGDQFVIASLSTAPLLTSSISTSSYLTGDIDTSPILTGITSSQSDIIGTLATLALIKINKLQVNTDEES